MTEILEIIRQIESHGAELTLTSDGKIRIKGDSLEARDYIARIMHQLLENREALVKALRLRQESQAATGQSGQVAHNGKIVTHSDATIPSSSLVKLPAKRCRACNSWLFWVSEQGAVVCSTCHPPPSRDLVKSWYWLPEGTGKRIQ